MIRVNLLPPTETRFEPRSGRLAFAGFGLGVLCVLSVAGEWRHRQEIAVLQGAAAELEVESKSLDRLAAELRGLEAERTRREARLAAVEAWRDPPGAAVAVVRDLTGVVQDGLWLVDYNAQAGTVSLTGRALDPTAVSRFVDRLAALGGLSDVELLESGSDAFETTEGAATEGLPRQFVVQARLRGPILPAPLRSVTPIAAPGASPSPARSAAAAEVL